MHLIRHFGGVALLATAVLTAGTGTSAFAAPAAGRPASSVIQAQVTSDRLALAGSARTRTSGRYRHTHWYHRAGMVVLHVPGHWIAAYYSDSEDGCGSGTQVATDTCVTVLTGRVKL